MSRMLCFLEMMIPLLGPVILNMLAADIQYSVSTRPHTSSAWIYFIKTKIICAVSTYSELLSLTEITVCLRLINNLLDHLHILNNLKHESWWSEQEVHIQSPELLVSLLWEDCSELFLQWTCWWPAPPADGEPPPPAQSCSRARCWAWCALSLVLWSHHPVSSPSTIDCRYTGCLKNNPKI